MTGEQNGAATGLSGSPAALSATQSDGPTETAPPDSHNVRTRLSPANRKAHQ